MTTKFIIKALPKGKFNEFMRLSDEKLASMHARWQMVDSSPGNPCRVSLIDAKVGEKVLALPFIHHDVDSPYRASGPIFVREHAETVHLGINEIPTMLRHRQLSLRAYDTNKIMIEAGVVQGEDLELFIEKQFNNVCVEYIHIHNAAQGCFHCAVYRA